MTKYATVDDYLAALPDDRRAVMEQLRQTIRAAVPEATESIAYAMPSLRLRDRFLLSYDAFKRHYSFFPRTQRMVDELGPELAPYMSGKGTLRFPADRPVPLELIARIVRIRVAEVSTGP
jgi:uncharacterized protein YdhG (YjbR/CyaY superfamily)